MVVVVVVVVMMMMMMMMMIVMMVPMMRMRRRVVVKVVKMVRLFVQRLISKCARRCLSSGGTDYLLLLLYLPFFFQRL